MFRAEHAIYFFSRLLARCFYRVNALGIDNLPRGGFLLLPNHITWVDAIVLQLASPRPIRYIIEREFYRKPFLNPLFRLLRCIPIDGRHSHSAIRAATEKIGEGEIVCLFPEGALERGGTLLRLRRGYELIARHANAAVVPVWLDQLWGSIFSFKVEDFSGNCRSESHTLSPLHSVSRSKRTLPISRRCARSCSSSANFVSAVGHR